VLLEPKAVQVLLALTEQQVLQVLEQQVLLEPKAVQVLLALMVQQDQLAQQELAELVLQAQSVLQDKALRAPQDR
jgi:hypothetical protein